MPNADIKTTNQWFLSVGQGIVTGELLLAICDVQAGIFFCLALVVPKSEEFFTL